MISKLEKLCIKWLNDNYSDLEPYETEKYSDYIFHMKNGKCILDYNKKNGNVYISYSEIWSFFESYFGMSNEQIQGLTKRWVEEHYKMGVTTTRLAETIGQLKVEEHYKMGVTTTTGCLSERYRPVEEHYKIK